MSTLTKGMFYWPSPEFSVPADNLCWHVPTSPNADYRCVREDGHPGKHGYAWSPKLRDYSHKETPEERTRRTSKNETVGAPGLEPGTR